MRKEKNILGLSYQLLPFSFRYLSIHVKAPNIY